MKRDEKREKKVREVKKKKMIQEDHSFRITIWQHLGVTMTQNLHANVQTETECSVGREFFKEHRIINPWSLEKLWLLSGTEFAHTVRLQNNEACR